MKDQYGEKNHMYTHGLSSHPLYNRWRSMWKRCTDYEHERYWDYGGRGILVDPVWDDLHNFMEWMLAEGWTPGTKLQLDRIDNDGDYSPDNCRLVTNRINSLNTRVRRTNSSGYTGVHYCNRDKRWIARVEHKGSRYRLGGHNTAKEANRARNNFIMKNSLPHKLQI